MLVTTPNAIIHVDQSGKKTGLAFSGWANRVTDLSKIEAHAKDTLALENSRILFVTAEVCLLFLLDGRLRALRVQRDGRTISRLVLLDDELGTSVPPSCVELIRSHLSPRSADGARQCCFAFVCSMVGNSEMIRVEFKNEVINSEEAAAIDAVVKPEVKTEDTEMDEDDIDIYGSADAKEAAISAEAAARTAANTRFVVRTRLCWTLEAYGPIRSGVIGAVEQEASASVLMSFSIAAELTESVFNPPF